MQDPPPEPRSLSSVMLGIAYMLGMTFLSAIMNSAARHVTETIHPFEIVFFRNLFSILFVLPLLPRYGWATLKTQRFRTHIGRACLNVVNMLLFFTAITMTPLAEVVALGFSAPIIATFLAVIILGEVVGWRRWTAILVALGQGVTLMAAATWAGCLLFIKTLSKTEHSITIVTYATFLMTPLSLVPALFVWQWPNFHEFLWLAFIGISGGCAQFFLAQALHETDLSVIMPFDFTKLIWVSLIAFLFFGEIPELTTWIGGAVIFAAGLYIAQREAAKEDAERDELER